MNFEKLKKFCRKTYKDDDYSYLHSDRSNKKLKVNIVFVTEVKILLMSEFQKQILFETL